MRRKLRNSQREIENDVDAKKKKTNKQTAELQTLDWRLRLEASVGREFDAGLGGLHSHCGLISQLDQLMNKLVGCVDGL